MSAELLIRHFDHVFDSKNDTELLRDFFLDLALRGDLTASTLERRNGHPVANEQLQRGMVELVRTRPRYKWKPAATATSGEPAIPLTWRATELANTGLYINGIAFNPTDWTKTGRPIIRIQNLSGLNSEYHYADGDFEVDNLAEMGDILVSWSATLDTFVWKGPQGVINQHIFKVVPNQRAVSSAFLFWLLKHEVRQLARSQHAHGLAMMHINRGPFLAHRVLLPPTEEQHCIVAKIEELMDLCDQIEQSQRALEQHRDEMRTASFHRLTSPAPEAEWAKDVRFFLNKSLRVIARPENMSGIRSAIVSLAVTGGLMGGSPKADKEQQPLRSVASLQNGYAFKSEWFQSSGIRLVRNVNVGHGRIDWTSRVCVPETMAEEFDRFALAAGDIVVSLDRPFITTGTKVALIREHDLPCLLLQRVGRFQLDDERIDPNYLFLWVQSGSFSDQIDPGRSNGVPHISTKQIEGAKLLLPPLDEQRRIVGKVNELMAVCDELESALMDAQHGRARLLESLLHEVLHEEHPLTISGST